MPNEVKQLEGGKLEVKLETGEVFTGDPLEVTNKMAEAHVQTKRWGQGFKQELDTLKSTPPLVTTTPTPASDPSEAQLQQYLADQQAKYLGYGSAQEMKADLEEIKEFRNAAKNQSIAASFQQACPDFPNNDEASNLLAAKITELHWDFSPQSMIAAHALCLREGKYQALPQNVPAAPSTPTAPPLVTGSTVPQATPQNEYSMPIDQLRAQLLKTPFNRG